MWKVILFKLLDENTDFSEQLFTPINTLQNRSREQNYGQHGRHVIAWDAWNNQVRHPPAQNYFAYNQSLHPWWMGWHQFRLYRQERLHAWRQYFRGYQHNITHGHNKPRHQENPNMERCVQKELWRVFFNVCKLQWPSTGRRSVNWYFQYLCQYKCLTSLEKTGGSGHGQKNPIMLLENPWCLVYERQWYLWRSFHLGRLHDRSHITQLMTNSWGLPKGWPGSEGREIERLPEWLLHWLFIE